ncbi:hypothetical protein MUK72_19880 (plasmid) [Halococcus dombrowskii]|uniref:Uncharacterized protein n=1 Tax=Halococcus dombrowskii TaxID=179637 RepID=A0AAV3SMG8_HALDO|nr:hypothetical protein [Halococcus dombrowskii]UOO97597.1 hypothetical protein MUK72_19880 [Halococcus dombrowskii]
MSDAEQPPQCHTLGCENTAVEAGYCTECAEISPGVLEHQPDESHASSDDADSDGDADHDTSNKSGSTEGTPTKREIDDREPPHATEDPNRAFADAIAWFHDQIDKSVADHDNKNGDHPDRPTAAREYFHERGWTDDTIGDARLGWAPPNRTGLLDHLMREGYDREAILGTGLFTEDLRPLWQGRYVLPYFDADGQPVYAISRSTGSEGGGAVGYDGHPADGLSGKYAKPAHTKEYARISEPIYGLGSVEDGQPVLVTEGIADAITAHQAGYACISPVTTRFKHDDRERLREVLNDHNVPRAYVVQDAERPSSDIDEDGRLTLTQAGEGLRGALDTAAYLAENDIDARLAELPRPGLDKVDLDDYLREWTDDSLATVLASAKPAREHPAYDPQDAAIDAATRDQPDPLDGERSDASHSTLFDLDIRDASGLDADYRGQSPLGHHGESETYFVVIDERDVAYDHKYKAAYNALTYLLADAGERPPDSPNGRLDDAEVFAAWRHAKQKGILPDDDPIPRRALRHIAVDHGHCESSDIQDGWKLPRDAHDDALSTLEDKYGLNPGREPIGTGWSQSADEVDPTTLDVVLDPELAWQAAQHVNPEDLPDVGALDLEPTSDGEAWQCPQCANSVDVVRAVAIHRGSVSCCEEPLADDEYDATYHRAREEFGAPLPEYVSAATATDNWALIQGALSQLTHWHLSEIDSTITSLGDDEDVLAEIDPTWEDSASGERVIAFRSGGFYCREHDCTIDPLRLVALEAGLIDACDDPLAGEAFKQAYHIAREEYGAPLPEWTVGNPDHVPVLPPATDLLGEFTTDRDRLDDAREDVESLYRELASDSRQAHLLTALPALGKTTSVVKNADEYPALYLAPRKELMAEVAEKARTRGMTHMHLPVFSEARPNEPALYEAASLIREEGTDLLREFEDLAERIEEPILESDDGEEATIGMHVSVEEESDELHLERGSCPVANGQYGEAWMLAVHVARHLGHAPKDIHTHDEALFGESLPCHSDGGTCAYADAWEAANDPENPKDILIGHYGHGYVDGPRTYYSEVGEDSQVLDRTIAIDEFPGDVYDERFGEIYLDHATWLARALRSDVEDRQTLFEEDLWSDEWVRAWLRGNATSEIDAVADVDHQLDLMQRVLDALAVVDDILEANPSLGTDSSGGDETGLGHALRRVRDLGPEWDAASIEGACAGLRAALDSAADVSRQTIEQIKDTVLPPLATTAVELDDETSLGAGCVDALDHFGGDLTAMVEEAVTAFRERRDGAGGLVKAAQRALNGGEEGCRELALHAHDGYAHPLAYLLLHGVIAPEDNEDDDSAGATTIPTDTFSFDHEEGTNLKRTSLGRETIIVDRNHHGAVVHHPPAFAEADAQNPVVGLDATGRERLWSLATGANVHAQDIHETARERRAFLRDVLNLQVVQTSPHIQTYSGPPQSKNFDGDVALVESVSEEYAATQLRQDTLTATTKPGVITTKKARGEIEERIQDDIAAIDHYGNVTGSNALGELNLGVVLGCRHFGDAVVEKWAALAGETVHRSGKGADLEYDSETANTFLKHMRRDQTLQAILRFGRDKEGAVVFGHTAALAESLPVVGEGAVVRAFSEATKAVTNAAQRYRGREFAVSDVADAVDCSRRTVQRVLNEQVELGYLEKRETKNGLANGFQNLEQPSDGEIELPELDAPFDSEKDGPPGSSTHGQASADPDDSSLGVSSTGFVWVVGVNAGGEARCRSSRATLPAPEGTDPAGLPG